MTTHKTARPPWFWFLVGAGTLVLVTGFGCCGSAVFCAAAPAGCAGAFFKAQKQAKEPATAFTERLREKDIDGAYTLTTKSFQEGLPKAQFQEMLLRSNIVGGKTADLHVQQLQLIPGNELAVFLARIETQRGNTVPVTLHLKRVEETWRIDGIEFRDSMKADE